MVTLPTTRRRAASPHAARPGGKRGSRRVELLAAPRIGFGRTRNNSAISGSHLLQMAAQRERMILLL